MSLYNKSDSTSGADVTLSKLKEKYSRTMDEKWDSPLLVIAGSSVAAIIAAFSIYYTVVPLFHEVTGTPSDGEGILHSTGTENAWYSTGSGFVLVLLIAVFMVCAAGCLSLVFATNKDAIIVGILAVIGLSLAFNFAFRACEDLLDYQFILWTLVAVLVGVAMIVYGIMQVRWSMSAPKSDEKELSVVPKTGLAARSNWIYGLAAVGGISGLILVYVHWQIYGHISDRIAAQP